MRIVGGESRQQPAAEASDAWLLAAVAGVVFLVVGGMDTLLTFVPSNFGSTEWEFGSVTAALNGLPLPVLGAALLAAAGVVRGWRLLVRVLAGGMMLAVLAILALGFVYLTTLPQALTAASQTGGIGPIGIKRAAAKTVAQLVCYPVGLIVMATMCWRFTRAR
jgi:hypothetical protein